MKVTLLQIQVPAAEQVIIEYIHETMDITDIKNYVTSKR
jgi:hypothetical protein